MYISTSDLFILPAWCGKGKKKATLVLAYPGCSRYRVSIASDHWPNIFIGDLSRSDPFLGIHILRTASVLHTCWSLARDPWRRRTPPATLSGGVCTRGRRAKRGSNTSSLTTETRELRRPVTRHPPEDRSRGGEDSPPPAPHSQEISLIYLLGLCSQ